MLKANGIHVSNSKTSELRDPTDFNDKSRRKGDLTVTGLFDEGKTILDIGITHPTIDSSIPCRVRNVLLAPTATPTTRTAGLRTSSTTRNSTSASRRLPLVRMVRLVSLPTS